MPLAQLTKRLLNDMKWAEDFLNCPSSQITVQSHCQFLTRNPQSFKYQFEILILLADFIFILKIILIKNTSERKPTGIVNSFNNQSLYIFMEKKKLKQFPSPPNKKSREASTFP